jgi:predicted acylesterase/phospholipase RssA
MRCRHLGKSWLCVCGPCLWHGAVQVAGLVGAFAALALSGGGLRASLYHLGVLARLDDPG